jgi:hypothetical protein
VRFATAFRVVHHLVDRSSERPVGSESFNEGDRVTSIRGPVASRSPGRTPAGSVAKVSM